MKKSIFIILYVSISLCLLSCGVARQAKQASNLASCEFRILGVGEVSVAGVQFDNIKSVNDLNLTDAALLMAGLASPTMPLSLRLDVGARNPNDSDAGLQRLEYILFIDDIQMTSGMLDTPVVIPAKSAQVIPVHMVVDLKQVLSGKSGTALVNFCLNLSGSGSVPSRFTIKLKPTIRAGGTTLTYPGYITVNTEYKSK
jgi:hypothetical protein